MKKEKVFVVFVFVFVVVIILLSCEDQTDITGVWSPGLEYRGFAKCLIFFSDGSGNAGEEKMKWEVCRKKLIIEKGRDRARETLVFSFDIYEDCMGNDVLELTDGRGKISLYYKR